MYVCTYSPWKTFEVRNWQYMENTLKIKVFGKSKLFCKDLHNESFDVHEILYGGQLLKEQTKLDLKQPEPKPKTSSWIRFRFSRKPKLDILLRPRLCRNGLLSRNFGRNRNIGYNFGRNRLFCRILRDFWFHLIPISPYWPLAILGGFRLPQTLPPQTPAFSK